MRSGRTFDVIRSKFSAKVTKQLLEILMSMDWSTSSEAICRELAAASAQELDNKYVWLVGVDPAYFIQYQVDSYAIMKGYGRVVIVWKPKFLEYPSVVKLSEFGENSKTIKSMEVTTVDKKGRFAEDFYDKTVDFLKLYYGSFFFNKEEAKFETDMVTELKHFVSKISKDSYWHCVIDNHGSVDVSSRNGPYIRLRIRGVKDKYDKDLIIFSHQGKKQFLLRGKGLQVVSFVAMLVIFIAVISCPSETEVGFCGHKNELILVGAAIMMGLMGMRFMSRNKNKQKLDKKIQELEKQQ